MNDCNPRVVFAFDDADSAVEAKERLKQRLGPDASVEMQEGHDRLRVAERRIGAEPTPTRLVRPGRRLRRAIPLTLAGAAVGAVIGAVVFSGRDVTTVNRWFELLIFAVVGAYGAAVYSFVMAAGSGVASGKETDEGAEPPIITLAVHLDDDDRDSVMSELRSLGAKPMPDEPA